jgi:beta-phosphoglucomutase-like phosphatase (HAD superfamily)
MTPLDLMRNRGALLRLVIFDCDGVIVDSEPLANRVVVAELGALGWTMTSAETERLFLGMTFSDMVPVIERRLGRPVPPAWHEALKTRLIEVLTQEAKPIAGALEALKGVSALGVPGG